MSLSKQKYIVAAFSVFAVIYLSLAAAGGARGYSPIPHWDMWDGYLGFFLAVSDGNLIAWWAQHNEHRIVLARALFWLDLSFFKGMGLFLIVVNYVLASLSFCLYWKILKERLPGSDERFARNLIGVVILILLFSWAQEFNLTSGFQSQFFLAQLLPLLAFYLLHKTHLAKMHSTRLFIFACLTGLVAVGSMANGVLTLPLMVMLGMVLRMGWRRNTILLVLAIFSNSVYFYHYVAPVAHGSLRDAILHSPIELLRFMLLYLGSPFHYMKALGSKAVGEIAGLFLIGSAVWFAYRSTKKPSESSLQLALLTFLFYIGGTALGTAGGRLNLGLDTAFASRYTTPALMAWAAILVLYSPAMARGIAAKPARYLVPLFLVPVLLLPRQLEALDTQQGEFFERQIAVLALALGIKDDSQIGRIYPHSEWPLIASKRATEKNLSVFASPMFKDVKNAMGQIDTSRTSVRCAGNLDGFSEIGSDPRYVQVQGWLFETESKRAPEAIHILDKDGVVVGYAFTRQPRPDVKAVHPNAEFSGFKGYLQTAQLGKQIVLHGIQPSCELIVTLAVPPFRIRYVPFGKQMNIAKSDAVVGANEWPGSDFQKTNVDGFKVFGSYLHSDQDTGSLSLNLKRGDSIYYRSGPTGGKQLLLIDSERNYSQTMPVALDWVVLEFSNPNLPEHFTLKLIDSGAGWGEWSAIALRK